MKLAIINSREIILEKLKKCQKSLYNSGAHYTCICIILDKIRYTVLQNWEVFLSAQWKGLYYKKELVTITQKKFYEDDS